MTDRTPIRRAVIFLLSLTGAVAASAQMTPPNDTDLHASYCQAVISDFDIKYQEQAISQMQSGGTPEQPAAQKIVTGLRSHLDASRAALRRITLYLLPRLSILDPTGLMSARAAATDDIRRIESVVTSCSPECADPSKGDICMKECGTKRMPDLAMIQKKFDGCRDLSWLPF
jgi:hypothetical protein